MPFYRNLLIATGTIAVVCMMLKLFLNKGEESSKKNSHSEESNQIKKEQTDEKIEEKTKIVEPSESKRKLDNSSTGPEQAMKLFKPKANFFIAFPVNDVGIHHKVKKLQEKLIAKNSLLYPAIVKVSTLHVTLAVTHLAGEEDVKIIKNKLDEWAEDNVKKYFDKPCILNFTGVRAFNNSVAYVKLEECENYKKISDISESLNNVLSSSGYSTDKRNLTPHLTFLKLSKDFKLLRLKKKFINDFEELKECKEHFGTQEITRIQLLSMEEPKDKFGYYKCLHEIKVSDAQQDMDHSKCCSPIPKPKLTKKTKQKYLGQSLSSHSSIPA